ncbi:TPA: type IV secretion protein Rhs [Streptococcus suis]|nr:type IV secretion protein Rhs [Streptococcus suis]HEL2039123.1 type IV secretion protein Rhs [Streptococcus suis]HEM4944040.1 type IV secretion protein Rhs [Streptococcus suis]HEM5406167.1 type IV secretion protein Rhs [Streptococcus suis]
MTKNVELHLHKWSKMKGALGSVTENGSGGGFSGGSYSSWGGPAMSSYSGIGGSGSQGFANRIKSLVEITEKAKRAINDLDVDGAIGNLHFHDDHVTAISLQSKLTALETYAGKVQQYLKDKIDQPFYEKLDKVGDRLEALTIASYKTSNQIGFKNTEVIYSDAGQYMGTREVLAKEVGLNELYQVDNPYKTRLQVMYKTYKSSDDYKESKLTEEDYLFASHQTRAFTYHSLNDEKADFEGKRDLLLAAGVVILSIFCPPAGAVAGVALAAADMYSAASGKDWMTGRELDDGERLIRGAFALFDLVPGVGYLNDLAKTGKVAGLAGIKASLKTSFKEGMELAAKNVDNFKVVLKNADDFGKRVVRQVDNYGKQFTIFGLDLVDESVLGLSKAAQEGLERAKAFSLNLPTIGVVEDAMTGQRMMMADVMETTVGDTAIGSKLITPAEQFVKGAGDKSIARLKSRHHFYTTKEEFIELLKKGDIPEYLGVHSVDDILKQQDLIGKVDDGVEELLTNMRKGNYGEMTTDEIFRQRGYERISLDITADLDNVTHHGIDGVYYNPDGHPPYIIAEAKYGGSRLSYLKDGTKQMESKWIGDRLVDALGEEQARVITKEIKQGNAGTQLVKIKKNGHISIDNLDIDGNIIRP